MTQKYAYNKRWRKKHPEVWVKGKKQYYQRFQNAKHSHEGWSDEDEDAIMASDRPLDRELSKKLGRSIQAIQGRRCLLKKEREPRFRNDLLFAVDLGQFQAFDHGAEIAQRVPFAWKLNPGDRMRWDVCQGICGTLEVIAIVLQGGDAMCTVKKIS